MSYNNSVNINDCITDLQTLEDFDTQVENLKSFIDNAKLLVRDKKELQSIINILTMKNTKQKNTVYKVANKLNKMGLY